ncbi:CLUMA_CG012806, isoform A [Clunio marinus]|uniref:CLUMA_CG012806, isoform A n=1 Tax=Clunio marinus TaxID=568069 RepID=A0A1J1IGU6_9DIPT|nr:CLUMA_CG012806, isoform A [Clunio marinus]
MAQCRKSTYMCNKQTIVGFSLMQSLKSFNCCHRTTLIVHRRKKTLNDVLLSSRQLQSFKDFSNTENITLLQVR